MAPEHEQPDPGWPEEVPPEPPPAPLQGWTAASEEGEGCSESHAPGDASADPLRDASRGQRIQKVLAAAGVASRRGCEALIEEGVVRVNGRTVESLPAWVDPNTDDITVRGKPVRTAAPSVHIMLFKPRGVVCSSDDPEGRTRAIDLVDHPSRVRLYSVGRLDMDSSGLLLLTNDGAFAHLMTHPSHHVARVYIVTVNGQVEDRTIKRLCAGLRLTDERSTRTSRFESVTILRSSSDRTQLKVVLSEGRNRQIRRMFEVLGHRVRKLRRIAIGPLSLDGLRPGQWRELTPKEIERLQTAASRPRRRPERTTRRNPRPDRATKE